MANRESTLDVAERVTEREAMNAVRRQQYAARRAESMKSSITPDPPVVEPAQPFAVYGKGDGSSGGGP